IVDADEPSLSAEIGESAFTDSVEGSNLGSPDLAPIDSGNIALGEKGNPSPATEAALSSTASSTAAAVAPAPERQAPPAPTYKPGFGAADLQEALEVVQQLDPPGVGCRDLRECLLHQLRFHQAQLTLNKNGTAQVLEDAIAIVDQHLRAVQNKQHKEIAK